ncbi:conserved hypothetical protein [Frankia canadensis]|uniref:Uncharacterized protein n=1 Tax=Frankia canadensis TaxID=1836972 RepID=A0A2I2KKI4_9ACTN|nr:hypothetical protein [Frankia canadensis]SNQ46180.1 conserved hypothetical protein [Frankia canadensis]SOU53470.1 conserved hypothetical protein [Frankia canadensis]
MIEPVSPVDRPPSAVGLVGDVGMVRRLKALALTGPLHDLDARKAHLDGADLTVYAMAELGLHAIDLVTVAMDFDRGADHDQVLRRLVPLAAAQAPGRPAAEHERVAAWVLHSLINVGNVNRGFDAGYGTLHADGRYERRRFDFKLLVELADPHGEIYLRATDEAVTVLVGALDTDITSAQIAAEVALDTLIRRGRLADARAAAEAARYRTVQYAEQLRRQLDATRRNVLAVDWLEAMPALVDEALAHVEQRYRYENAILTHIRRYRDSADDPDHKRQAADLVTIVGDCIRRHTQLQARLLEAGAVFRAEQDRQQFATAPSRGGLDLHAQLLVPTLTLPAGDAERPAAAFFPGAVGVRTPRTPRILDLVDLLLRPPVERDTLGAEVVEAELVDLAEPPRFDDETWSGALRLLDLDPGAPRRLSALLAEARRADERDVADLVALLALHAVSPRVAASRQAGDETLTVAVDDGTVLDDPEFGGADLLVGRARLVTVPEADEAEAEADADAGADAAAGAGAGIGADAGAGAGGDEDGAGGGSVNGSAGRRRR